MIEENAATASGRMRDMPSRKPDSARNKTAAAAAAPVDQATIEAWALSYLGLYAASAATLRRVLRRRVLRRLTDDREAVAAADALIETLIVRYREARLIDDAAYAAGRARRDLARGRSPRRIAAGLAAKGIGGTDAAAALAALGADSDSDGGSGGDPELAAAAIFARRRRLGPYRTGETAGRDRELAAFARAGFTRGVAEAVLGCADEDTLAALLAEGR